jgi:hypothetical protein
MTEDEFFGSDGETSFVDSLAAILGIPVYRIRIVDSYPGSVFLKVYIDEDVELEGQETTDGSDA